MACEKWERGGVGTEQNIGNVSWNVVEELGTIDKEFIKKKCH